MTYFIPEELLPPPKQSWKSVLAKLSHEEQERILGVLRDEEIVALNQDWFLTARREQFPPPHNNWFIWVLMAGRGFGKLLDLNTSIPTPTGWTTMEEIQVGDQVFDEVGIPCRVTYVSEVQQDKTYKIIFSDGETIVAGASHQWVTWTHAERKSFSRSPYVEDKARFPNNWPQWRAKRLPTRNVPENIVISSINLKSIGATEREIEYILGYSRKALRRYWKAGKYFPPIPKSGEKAIGPQVRTTQEILDTLTYGKRGDTNHCIPLAGVLDCDEVELPIPPYTLGIWLGDGSKSSGGITTHPDDQPEIISGICREGQWFSRHQNRLSWQVNNLASRLGKAGLLNNKHVPDIYLRASIYQRLSLLKGLMDSDGGVGNACSVEFCNTNKRIIDATYELIVSLGMKVVRSSRIGKIGNTEYKKAWRLTFTPNLQVFHLKRKADKLKFAQAQSLRNHHRMIISIEETLSIPMRCISVDSPHNMYLAGRGMIPTHNTYSGANWIINEHQFGGAQNSAIIAATSGDLRRNCVDGPSGIVQIAPPWFRPDYKPTQNKLVWPNGTETHLYTSEKPERLRGPNHDRAWGDELSYWRYVHQVWDNLMMTMRYGSNNKFVITMTPRPIEIVKRLEERAKLDNTDTIFSRGSSYDNLANLSGEFAETIKRYKGTHLERQEIYGEYTGDVDGALWSRDLIEENRRDEVPSKLTRIVVGVDPAMTGGEYAAETGIVVAGLVGGKDPHAYVLGDYSMKGSPSQWARKVVQVYQHHKANLIVAERNQGGELVSEVLKNVDAGMPIKLIHAKVGKVARAEPVALLDEQHRIHHIGVLPELEDQMCLFVPGDMKESPDRVDARVYALTELLVKSRRGGTWGRGVRDKILRVA